MTRRLSRAARRAIFARQGGVCPVCRTLIDPYSIFDIDHIQALGLGGGNDRDNLRAVHPWCHRPKSAVEKTATAKADRLAKGRAAHDEALRTRTKPPNAKQRARARMDAYNREFGVAPRQE